MSWRFAFINIFIKERDYMIAEKKKVYIVDDDESVCRALKILLRTFDFEAETFNSARNFFDTVSKDDHACLLLDINMPEMNGWETQKEIMVSGSKRPIIFISAEKSDIAAERALKIGAVGFLQKPVNGQTLVDLINSSSEDKCVVV
jgi:FixJ family two-component response regulator